jgi:membrane protein required for colicin V production
MIWLDYVFLGIVLFSLLMGMLRGFAREALSLLSWIVAFVVTLRHAPQLAEWLRPALSSPMLRLLSAYVLTFFAVLLAGALLSWVLGALMRGAGLSGVDRALGAGFGLLRGGFVLAALVLIGLNTSLHEEPAWRRSMLIPEIRPAAEALRTLIPDGWLAYLRARDPRESVSLESNPAEH